MNSTALNGTRLNCACLAFGAAAMLAFCADASAETDEPVTDQVSRADPVGEPQATLEQAEFNYRARRLSAAMEQFGMVAAMQDHPFAWLRVGNICHRRGDAGGALDAYQRAARAASRSPEFAELGNRAIMNQALLGLDQAQLALEALGMKNTGGADKLWVDEMQLRLDELSAAIPDIAVKDALR